jgi:hypothetical protein
MRIHAAVSCVAIAVVTLLAPRAEASPMIFTDRASFEAAVQIDALVTFDTFEMQVWNVPLAPSGPVYCWVGICTGVADGTIRLVSSDQAPNPPNPFGGNLAMTPFPNSSVDLELVGGGEWKAVGFDVSSFPPQSLRVGWVDFGGPGSPPVFDGYEFQSPSFVGLLFSSPVDRIGLFPRLPVYDFSGPYPAPLIVDNISIATVPEPATLALFACAIVLMQAGRSIGRRCAKYRNELW